MDEQDCGKSETWYGQKYNSFLKHAENINRTKIDDELKNILEHFKQKCPYIFLTLSQKKVCILLEN